jgi:hypothetical protein
LADLPQHARELLEIIRDEIVIANGSISKTAQDALDELRSRVVALEQSLLTLH